MTDAPLLSFDYSVRTRSSQKSQPGSLSLALIQVDRSIFVEYSDNILLVLPAIWDINLHQFKQFS